MGRLLTGIVVPAAIFIVNVVDVATIDVVDEMIALVVVLLLLFDILTREKLYLFKYSKTRDKISFFYGH